MKIANLCICVVLFITSAYIALYAYRDANTPPLHKIDTGLIKTAGIIILFVWHFLLLGKNLKD